MSRADSLPDAGSPRSRDAGFRLGGSRRGNSRRNERLRPGGSAKNREMRGSRAALPVPRARLQVHPGAMPRPKRREPEGRRGAPHALGGKHHPRLTAGPRKRRSAYDFSGPDHIARAKEEGGSRPEAASDRRPREGRRSRAHGRLGPGSVPPPPRAHPGFLAGDPPLRLAPWSSWLCGGILLLSPGTVPRNS